MIVVGGAQGLLYVIDVRLPQPLGLRKETSNSSSSTPTLRRVLKGHGGEILHIAFSPEPHVFASASADKTVRVWKLGPPGQRPDFQHDDEERRSWNYAMGKADEPDDIHCILVGEGVGGHQAGVVGLAFHPMCDAIATCGMDYQVRIWPLPKFPDFSNDSKNPPQRSEHQPPAQRPHLVQWPLFATGRLHEDVVESIEW